VVQPAVKQDQHPANDSDYTAASDNQTQVEKGENHPQDHKASLGNNPVKRAVDDFSRLIAEMDDIRENLRAHGIPLRTTRMIVEFGIQEKIEKQADSIDSALGQAHAKYGEGSITREKLESDIATIVELERDLTHARFMAREAGLDAQALSTLTQMVQNNPGDGGKAAVNTFLGYAVAIGIKTDQLSAIVKDITEKSDSVLPKIARKSDTELVKPWKKIFSDAVVGLLIGISIIWLLM